MRSLEDKEHSGWPLEVDNNQLRGSSKLILLQLHEKLPKSSTSTILWSFIIWSKLERWKKFISVCLMSWLKIKKNHHFEVSSSLILCNSNKSFLYWIVKCDKKWILYDNQQWLVQWLGWEETQKHFPKPNLYQKMSQSLFGSLLAVWSTTAFWILAKPLHLRSMLSKPMRRTENCSACSQHWSTECTQFFSMTTPNYTLHNQHVKSWTNWATKFCLICHIHLTAHQLITTSSSISTSFCEENASTTSGT